LGIPEPESGMASSIDEGPGNRPASAIRSWCGPPMCWADGPWRWCTTRRCCATTWQKRWKCRPERPILIDKFLENAIEAEADAICDGKDAFVPAVMEHIEQAGVHSGDSACVIPPVSIPEKHLKTIEEYTKKIAIEWRSKSRA
jgi:carbamoyl-phosphate synthase large subunit